MKEIEMKAHVADRDAVIQRLNSFANFCGHVIKDDTYWGKEQTKIRVRKEKTFADDDTLVKETVYLTYKKKESRISSDGKMMEVNEEKECTVSSAEPVEAFLSDAGFSVCLKKHKDVLSWKHDSANVELCTVPPLGDFLEIEFLSESEDEETTNLARKKIMEIFSQCKISEDMIENRYYSNMLRAAEK